MRLNHVNLTVSDVPAAANFLMTYFGLRTEMAEDARRNFVVLFDDNGLVLTLMPSPRGAEVQYPGSFHIGFIQPSAADVDALYARLTADGFAVQPPQQHHAWTFTIDAPGGLPIEVLG